MSRTDVHRPGWVKERDPYLRHLFVEDHDHSQGPCDLDAWFANPHLPWVAVSCRLHYIGRRNIYCGCKLCTSQLWRKLDNKRERVRWRSTRANPAKLSLI